MRRSWSSTDSPAPAPRSRWLPSTSPSTVWCVSPTTSTPPHTYSQHPGEPRPPLGSSASHETRLSPVSSASRTSPSGRRSGHTQPSTRRSTSLATGSSWAISATSPPTSAASLTVSTIASAPRLRDSSTHPTPQRSAFGSSMTAHAGHRGTTTSAPSSPERKTSISFAARDKSGRRIIRIRCQSPKTVSPDLRSPVSGLKLDSVETTHRPNSRRRGHEPNTPTPASCAPHAEHRQCWSRSACRLNGVASYPAEMGDAPTGSHGATRQPADPSRSTPSACARPSRRRTRFPAAGGLHAGPSSRSSDTPGWCRQQPARRSG